MRHWEVSWIALLIGLLLGLLAAWWESVPADMSKEDSCADCANNSGRHRRQAQKGLALYQRGFDHPPVENIVLTEPSREVKGPNEAAARA